MPKPRRPIKKPVVTNVRSDANVQFRSNTNVGVKKPVVNVFKETGQTEKFKTGKKIPKNFFK
ncbi:MAG: hypothetical protein V1672_03435 [Candidatus Diapherotrites archaeon]